MKFKMNDKVIFCGQHEGKVVAYEPTVSKNPYVLLINTKNGDNLVKASESQLKPLTEYSVGDTVIFADRSWVVVDVNGNFLNISNEGTKITVEVDQVRAYNSVFNIRDKVVHKRLEAIVWGKYYNSLKDEYEYSIRKTQGFVKGESLVVNESYLRKAKEKDNLEKGDIFTTNVGNVIAVEVLAVIKDNGKVYYTGKSTHSESIYTWPSDAVESVIYD